MAEIVGPEIFAFVRDKSVRFTLEPWEPELTSDWLTPKDGKFYIHNIQQPNSEVSHWRAYEGSPPEGAQYWRLRLWMFKQRLWGRCTKKHKSL